MYRNIEIIEQRLSQPNGIESIEEEIKLLFNAISETKSIENATSIFEELEVIQMALAKSVFKDGLKVSSFLRDFIYDFDRIDDDVVKKFQYDKIKVNGSSSQ